MAESVIALATLRVFVAETIHSVKVCEGRRVIHCGCESKTRYWSENSTPWSRARACKQEAMEAKWGNGFIDWATGQVNQDTVDASGCI